MILNSYLKTWPTNLLIHVYIYIYVEIHMCVCMCVCVHMCKCNLYPKDQVIFKSVSVSSFCLCLSLVTMDLEKSYASNEGPVSYWPHVLTTVHFN